ncbi:MAG: hypothetical protein AAGE86_07015 [Pseudomonadota bacterium]
MLDELLEVSVSPDDMPKRYRKGCWVLLGVFIALLIIFVIYVSIEFPPS